jgi:hypothetical protein
VVGTLRYIVVHRVACTIEVFILEKHSDGQTKMMLQNEVSRAQNMEYLGAISVCLLEQLRPFIAYEDFCHVLHLPEVLR